MSPPAWGDLDGRTGQCGSPRHLSAPGSLIAPIAARGLMFSCDTMAYATLTEKLLRAVDRLPNSRAKELFRRSEEHTSELQSQSNLVCRLLLEKKKAHLHSSHSQISYTIFCLTLKWQNWEPQLGPRSLSVFRSLCVFRHYSPLW